MELLLLNTQKGSSKKLQASKSFLHDSCEIQSTVALGSQTLRVVTAQHHEEI